MSDTTAGAIVDSVGGPDNIASLTHCATRLRFQLKDASVVDTAKVEAIPGVMGGVPQTGDRYQVVIGGAVESVYNEINALPQMRDRGAVATTTATGEKSDADVKAEMRAKGPRGNRAWLDNFFEFLADSFRPIIGALLGASLFITFMSLMATLGIIGNWADPRVQLEGGWPAVNLMWQGVFTFLPLMIAYNASKKLGADPWVGFGIMAVLLLPGFSEGLGKLAHETHVFGQTVKIFDVFGLPLTVFGYGSSVFPPLLMAAVLGPLYKGLKKIIPANLQLIFVPFLAMLVMIPLTAFVIGPIGVYLGAFIGSVLTAVNNFSPLIFAIIIPLAYPFMVPLGLHWPLNAVMLLNIQTLGYDFIQGPMGAWNFACFGATAGVLLRSLRHKDVQMRQTATGALAAGLLGGISEPSLYGIHLRFKRIYPRMLVGCLAGGLIIGFGGGLKTNAFVFTSLLTIPAFDNIPLYVAGIAAAFFIAMALVYFSDYMTKDERAAAEAAKRDALAAGDAAALDPARPVDPTAPAAAAATAGTATAADATRTGETRTLSRPQAAAGSKVLEIGAPVEGEVVPLSRLSDGTFSAGIVGPGVAVVPSGTTVVAPGAGTVLVASGRAVGLALENGVEVLLQVGVGAAATDGHGVEVRVRPGQKVTAGETLMTFDRSALAPADRDLVIPMVVTNRRDFASADPMVEGTVGLDRPVLAVTTRPVTAGAPA